MIITGEKVYLKSYDKKMSNELNLDNKVSELKKIQDELENPKVNRKNGKMTNNDSYKSIRNKASVLKNDSRNIQDKISLIQVQEQNVDNMEVALKQAKTYYLQELKNGKTEEAKEKIKIRKIQKQINDINEEYKTEIIEIKDSQKVLDTLNIAFKRINDIKGKLSQYKARLLSLEALVEENKNKLEKAERVIENSHVYEYEISKESILNASKYIFIEGDMNMGIIIDIFI